MSIPIKGALSNCRRGEADLKQGKISYNSPIARGVIGKRQGTEVEIGLRMVCWCFEIARFNISN